MKKMWHDAAWDEYTAWQTEDKKTLQKISEIARNLLASGVSLDVVAKSTGVPRQDLERMRKPA
jgi:hypothetical protein